MHRIRLAVRENTTSGIIREEHYNREIEVSGRGWVVEQRQEIVAFSVAVVEWLFAQGVHRIWLSTAPGTRAQRFYEEGGWKFQRVLPGGERFYELQNESAA